MEIEIVPHREDLTREINWADCPQCGGGPLLTLPDAEGESVWDDDPWVCAECGCLGEWTVDEDTAYPFTTSEKADEKLYNRGEWNADES